MPNVETSVVTVDPLTLGNPVVSAMATQQPAHVLRFWTANITRRNEIPVRVVWEMDVADTQVSKEDKPDGKHLVRARTRMIYKARAEGDACAESDTLANSCGQAMGKFFADMLRTGHVMLLPPGA